MTKLDCGFFDDDAVEFVYGTMEAEKAARFQAHLPACRACRREVADLQNLADFCKQRRAEPAAEVPWRKSFVLAGQRSSWWRLFLGWAPLAAATLLLVVVGVLTFGKGNSRKDNPVSEQTPAVALAPQPKPAPQPVQTPAPAPEAAAVAKSEPIIHLSGTVHVIAKGQQEAVACTESLAWSPDQTLETPPAASGKIAMPDGSQVALVENTRLRLIEAGERGDTLELLQGTVTCKVTPRSPDRPFSVQAGPALVTVKGTRFAVSKISEHEVRVAVAEGVVTVGYQQGNESKDLVAGQEAILSAGVPIRVQSQEPRLRNLLLPNARHSAEGSPPATPKKNPLPPLVEPTCEPESPSASAAPEPPPAVPNTAAAPATADTNAAPYLEDSWVFDMLRTDMEQGRYTDVLRHLENYLADPESPSRPEAQFLKASCLEAMKRYRDASEAYQRYLQQWPQGAKAAKASEALTRLKEKTP